MAFSTEQNQIYIKVVELCNLCDLDSSLLNELPSAIQVRKEILNLIISAIEYVKGLKDEYLKLQESIQKKEADIRKHIGLEQQLKLYSESLEQQLDESQFCRSEFIEKTRKMLSDIKRDNHFLHQENVRLKEQLSSAFNQQGRSRNKTFNIDVDLRKHMRTESSKQYIQKNPSRQKLVDAYISLTKNAQMRKNNQKQSLTSVDRKRQIQCKIKQLNEKATIDQTSRIYDKLYSNSSYNQFYSRKDTTSKKPQRGSMKKNKSSKKNYLGTSQQKVGVQKIHYKTRSINRDM